MLICFLLKRTPGHFNSKCFLPVFLMTRTTRKKTSYYEFENKFSERKLRWIWTRLRERLVTCKSPQLQFVEIWKMVFSRSCMEYFNLRITKCGWRNVLVGCCENHSNIYTGNEEAVLIRVNPPSLSITFRRFFSFRAILRWPLEIVAGLYSCLCLQHAFVHKKNISVDKKWSSSFAGRVLTLVCHTVTLQLVEKSVQIRSHLICVCTFLLQYKIVYGFLTFADAWFGH